MVEYEQKLHFIIRLGKLYLPFYFRKKKQDNETLVNLQVYNIPARRKISMLQN